MINPYLKLPIILPGNEGDEEKEAEVRLQPDQIQAYHPMYFRGSLIHMLGGGCVLMSRLSCDELDRIIDFYWKTVSKKEKDAPIISLLQ